MAIKDFLVESYELAGNILRINQDQAEQNNPKLETFDDIDNEDIVQDLSVVDQYFKDQEANQAQAYFDSYSTYKNYIYGSIPTEKPTRLATYRSMAAFPEVGDAIDEICDASLNYDENFESSVLKINRELEEGKEKEIQKGFHEVMELFEFDDNMFEHMRNFVVDGQLCWENLISEKHKDYGIVGINLIKPEQYEFAFKLDDKTKQGIVVYTNEPNEETVADIRAKNATMTKQGGLTLENISSGDDLQSGKALFLPWEQLTYIDTGIYNSDGLIVYPVLERARRAYNQLTLIEDSIIIYRLVRAPERLVFNVDVGGLPRSKAESEVLKMMKRYNTKKVYNTQKGTVSNDYDVHSMLESYWFVKPEGGDGTSVEAIGGGQNLGELEDLQYFLRKLYIALKVPYNRYAEPTINIERVDSINYEEYRFAKFIMRLQSRFAMGLKDTLVTHLKLKGIWDKLKIKERDIKIQFVPPAAYELYESQQILDIKINNYNNLKEALTEPNSIGLKKYMNFSDEEVDEVWKSIESDAIKTAEIQWKVNNVEETGKPEGTFEEDDDDMW